MNKLLSGVWVKTATTILNIFLFPFKIPIIMDNCVFQKSSFSKFDQLQKSVLHVRSSDPSKIQKQIEQVYIQFSFNKKQFLFCKMLDLRKWYIFVTYLQLRDTCIILKLLNRYLWLFLHIKVLNTVFNVRAFGS